MALRLGQREKFDVNKKGVYRKINAFLLLIGTMSVWR